MRRSQKIMSLILAALMLLSSLPGWAENEPIVIVESVETPAPQAEETPEATAVSTSAPTATAPKQTPAEEEPPEKDPAGGSASTPATLSLVEEESSQNSIPEGGQTPANKETTPASENGASSAPAQDKVCLLYTSRCV